MLGQELPALVDDGYTSFKVFMTYEDLALTDLQMLEVFSVARETGALVMVHAENYDAIRFLTDRLERAGKIAPRFHGTSRPIPVEREATHRAISLAELVDVPIMIVHVSNGEAMRADPRAQSARPQDLWRDLPAISACSPRRTSTGSTWRAPNMSARRRRATRPARRPAGKACETGVFQIFSSDHCPFRYDDTPASSTPKGRTSFRWVPNGIPGIETRLPILFSEGVGKGRISLNEFVALTATNHAKIYGLYQQGHDRGRLRRRHRHLGSRRAR